MLSLFYIVYAIAAICLLACKYRFDRARNSIPHRIAIIGSSPSPELTGAITAIVSSSGLHTYGAIDGTAEQTGNIILPDGSRARLTSASRFKSRTLVRLVWSFARRGADAVIYEAKPGSRAQRWLQPLLSPRTVILPTVSSIPTVTVEDIKQATRLIRGVPHNATLVTAEHRHGILSVLRHESRRRSIRLIEIKDDSYHEGAVTGRKRASNTTMDRMEGLVSHVGTMFDVRPKQALELFKNNPAKTVHAGGRHTLKEYDCTHRIRTGLQVIIRKVDATSVASGR